MKPDYIRKLIKMELPEGYKFDVANYLHNPAYGYDYPAFIKQIGEDETTITERRVCYMKYYDGRGEYLEKISVFKKDGTKNGWVFAKSVKENVLEAGNRFNLNKLISLI